MPGDSNAHLIDHAEKLGSILTKLETMSDRQDVMDKKLDGVVAMTNRWKGATAVLIIIGGLLGYLGNIALNLYVKVGGKA